VSYFKPCALSQVSRRFHEDSIQFSSQNSRFLCSRLDEPLKASGRPAVSRSFSIVVVWTTELHRSNDRSSHSKFNTELDFKRQYLGRFCQTSGRRGNTPGRYPMFQNIPGLLYGCRKEWQHWPSGRSVKPSRHGPVLGRIALFLKGGCRRPSGHYLLESNFELN
jgi:hypothetical protein